MSDEEGLPVTAAFSRGSRARSSLPLSHSSPSRERALGVLYLQYGDETKQIQVSSGISSLDALRALFVKAFPQQLTMKILQSPNTVICIKDSSWNSYYGLEDVRSLSSHCCLKVYHKDPGQVFSRQGWTSRTEPRISKELLYGSHSAAQTLTALHSLQGSMSPPMVRSVPSSPSRTGHGGSAAKRGPDPFSATLPRERLSGAGRSSKLCSNSSAILERRDVLPDEDAGPSLALVGRPEGAPRHSDSFCSSVRREGGRVSLGSSQCSAPPSVTADLLVGGAAGIGIGLPRFQASVKPLLCHGEHNSLHRPNIRQKYGDFPLLGAKSPPPSPQRRTEGQIIGGLGLVDCNGVPLEVYSRKRGSHCGSSSSASSVFADSPLAQTEAVFQRHLSATDSQSERISAMEEQIASLAGLVHRALSLGSEIPEIQDLTSENSPHSLIHNEPGLTVNPNCPENSFKHRLSSALQSVTELRLQLKQLRLVQMSNQDQVNSMLRVAGQELMGFMREKLIQALGAAHGPRAEVERDRRQYVDSQDRILSQLSELEEDVARLQKTSQSGPGHSVSLRDVEVAAVDLRKVGQAMAVLKGDFPGLQSKMCSVLRLEMEVVRFLKDEPFKVDSMLSRIRNLSEHLSTLHRSVSESKDNPGPLHKVQETDGAQIKTQGSPKPLPRSSFRVPVPPPEPEGVQTGSFSPVTTRRTKCTAATNPQTLSRPPLDAPGPDSVKDTATKRQSPDGSVSVTQTNRDQPDSTQCDQALQDTQTSREGHPPASVQQTSSDRPAEEQNKSVLSSEEHPGSKQKDELDSCHFKRPERASTGKKPCPDKAKVSSSGRSEEPAGAQVECVKVHPVALQPKPPRQPPEVKPKPPKRPTLLGTSASTRSSATATDKEKDNKTSQERSGVTTSFKTETTQMERADTAHVANHNKPTSPHTCTHHVPTAGLKEERNNNQDSVQKTVEIDKSSVLGINPKSPDQINDGSSTVNFKRVSFKPTEEETVQQVPEVNKPSLTLDLTLSNEHKLDFIASGPGLSSNQQSQMTKIKNGSSPSPLNNKVAPGILKNSLQSPKENLTNTTDPDLENSDSAVVAFENQGFEDFCVDFTQEPFIVFWNEPIDIEAAFKRLSTIFECEEELAKSRENVLNDEEQKPNVGSPLQFTFQADLKDSSDKQESDSVKKTDNKKRFKLKFPKNKLAQLSRAIRSGSAKANKKEKETESQDKQTKQTNGQGTKSLRISSPRPQVKVLCKNALDSIDSLEESIKQLEMSVDSIGLPSSPPQSPDLRLNSKDKCSTSKRPASQILKDTSPSQSKKPKPQPGRGFGKTSNKKQTPSQLSQDQPQNSSPKNSTTKMQTSHKQAVQAQVMTVPQ